MLRHADAFDYLMLAADISRYAMSYASADMPLFSKILLFRADDAS